MASGSSLEYRALSDIGRRRSINQDAQAVVEPWSREQYRRRGWLFIVADGMGAHAAGEMASDMAVKLVDLGYEKLVHRSPPLALRAGIEQANTEIHARGETAAELKGMGTTCTALALLPRGALVGHVGDSRAYKVRGATIEQLTRDHSLVWDLEAQGLPADDASRKAPKNIITRSIGPHAAVQVDVEGPFDVAEGDVFVLCSDGLSGQVADAEIGALAAGLPPDAAATALVGLALVRGAPDNVTVIVARAGAKEVSKARDEEPWILHDEPAAPREPPGVPWRPLVVACAGLLGALVLSPGSELMRDVGPVGRLLGGLREPVAWIACGFLLLSAIAALLWAVIGYFVPAGTAGRSRPAGGRFGKGPYRTYDCRPTAELIEGIVASVESAADAVPEEVRGRALAGATRARERAAAGDATAALEAAAAAVGAYARFVESSRGSAKPAH